LSYFFKLTDLQYVCLLHCNDPENYQLLFTFQQKKCVFLWKENQETTSNKLFQFAPLTDKRLQSYMPTEHVSLITILAFSARVVSWNSEKCLKMQQ
jgi:hypothetical protein